MKFPNKELTSLMKKMVAFRNLKETIDVDIINKIYEISIIIPFI